MRNDAPLPISSVFVFACLDPSNHILIACIYCNMDILQWYWNRLKRLTHKQNNRGARVGGWLVGGCSREILQKRFTQHASTASKFRIIW